MYQDHGGLVGMASSREDRKLGFLRMIIMRLHLAGQCVGMMKQCTLGVSMSHEIQHLYYCLLLCYKMMS